jgi:uncharacterized damage-inducible protein DinB
MNMGEAMAQEFLQEAAATERLLDRVPDDRLDWKPHEKSMPLGRLATHVAEIPGWGEVILDQPEFDVEAADFTPVIQESRDAILASFRNVRDAFVEKIRGKSDEELMETWTLKAGENTIADLPRAAAIRSWVLNHVIHHRAQLSVYLRLNDVPLPGVYGPSADEG